MGYKDGAMKTISVKIKPNDILRYGLDEASTVDFSELVDKITREFAIQALKKAHSVAELTGLSKLSAKEVDEEIRSLRNENRP